MWPTALYLCPLWSAHKLKWSCKAGYESDSFPSETDPLKMHHICSCVGSLLTNSCWVQAREQDYHWEECISFILVAVSVLLCIIYSYKTSQQCREFHNWSGLLLLLLPLWCVAIVVFSSNSVSECSVEFVVVIFRWRVSCAHQTADWTTCMRSYKNWTLTSWWKEGKKTKVCKKKPQLLEAPSSLSVLSELTVTVLNVGGPNL